MSKGFRALLALGGLALGLSMMGGSVAQGDGLAPVLTIEIVVVAGTQENLFEKLREFAAGNAFTVDIAPDLPGGQSFFIQLLRDDLKLLGGTSPFVKNQFDLGLYQSGDLPPSDEAVNEALSGLKEVVLSVQGASFEVARYP